MQWSHLGIVSHEIGVGLLLEHQKLNYAWGLVLNCQMQVGFAKLFKLNIDVFRAVFFLHLEYFNKFIRLVVLNELVQGKLPEQNHLLLTKRAGFDDRQACSLLLSACCQSAVFTFGETILKTQFAPCYYYNLNSNFFPLFLAWTFVALDHNKTRQRLIDWG